MFKTLRKAAPKGPSKTVVKKASKTVKKAAPKKPLPPSDSPLAGVGAVTPFTGTPGATTLGTDAPKYQNKAGAPTFDKPNPVKVKESLPRFYGAGRKLYLPSGLLTTADIPSYLDGSLPGDYGFDPLNLGESKEQVEKYREYELIHGRWAMLGAAGCFFPDALGVKGGFWQETGKVYLEGDTLTWNAPPFVSIDNPLPLPLIIVIQIGLMGAAENYRVNGTGPAGFAPNFGEFTESDFSGKDPINPGGPLDFLGLAKDEDELALLKVKEIKNARLAMVVMLAFLFQGIATHEGPYSNWAKHVVDPFGYNFVTIVGSGAERAANF